MQEYGVTGRQLRQSYVAPVEMHQQLYALYFVIYDCIFPKYILSYLILPHLPTGYSSKKLKTKKMQNKLVRFCFFPSMEAIILCRCDLDWSHR